MSMQTGITQYGSRTLVGNWSEDVQEDEIKFAEYLARKRKDELLLSERHAVFQHALQSCPLTYRCEGDSVCYGDSIMLENVETQGYLAVHPHGQSWAVSTWKTEDIRPVARNVFRIVLPSGEAPLDTPLRFGDTFCLVCDPTLTTDAKGVNLSKAWLTCEPKSFNRLAKLSSQSEVYFASSYSRNAEWKVESTLAGGHGWRVNTARTHLRVGEDFTIRHKMSNLALSSSTEFSFRGKLSEAQECEVFGKPSKKSAGVNTWRVNVACDPIMALENRVYRDVDFEAACQSLLDAIENTLDDFARMLEDIERHEALEIVDVVHAIKEYAPSLHSNYVECFLANIGELTVSNIMRVLVSNNASLEEKEDEEEKM